MPKAPAFGLFSALGNRFLLKRELAQVQVSRQDFGYQRIAKAGSPTSRRAGAGSALKIARDASGRPIIGYETPRYREKKDGNNILKRTDWHCA